MRVRRTMGPARWAGPIAALAVSAAVVGGPSVASASSWVVQVAGGSAGSARAVALSPPASVSAVCTAPATAATVTVSWAALPRATSYSVYQSTAPTSGFVVVASGLTTTTWTSAPLKRNNTYYFEVSASFGSTWSTPVSAATAGNAIHPRAPFCT